MKMNKRGQSIEKIIGGIFSIIVLIIFISAIIPLFASLNGSDEKQKEIDSLKNQISGLNQELSNKDIRISEIQANLDATGKTLNEKDLIISNLSGQLTEKDKQIQNLTEELTYLNEKGYLQDISNNYYTISNYFEKIENRFFPIEVSISLISITLFAVILKEFGLWSWIIKYLKKKKEKNGTTDKK